MKHASKNDPQPNIYEAMEEQKLFLKIRDDLLYTQSGIRLGELLDRDEPKQFIKEVNDYINRIYRISKEKIERFDTYIEKFIFAFHVLTELMEDKDITDIKVLAWNSIRIKRQGKRYNTEISFWSSEDYRGFVEMLAVKNGINTGTLNAIQTFTDKKSSEDFIFRFSISTGMVNSTGEPYLHIRKIPKQKYSFPELVDMGMLHPGVARYLLHRIKTGYTVICGRNGSGKTYLLNALLDEIPYEDSVLVVQENEELFSNSHPDMMFQHIVVRKGEKKVNYGLKELVVNGLLMDIDHMVIGEIKGEEALYFITAALSGCSGITTIHSVDAAGALDKLADYCKWASDYSREDIMKLLSCVSTMVYVEDFEVKEIAVNRGWDETLGCNRIETVYDSKKGVFQL